MNAKENDYLGSTKISLYIYIDILFFSNVLTKEKIFLRNICFSELVYIILFVGN